MAWGIFNKLKEGVKNFGNFVPRMLADPIGTTKNVVVDVAKAHARAARGVMNYYDKATTAKAEALDAVSPFIPQLRAIAPVLLVGDRLRKKITDPIVKAVNKINLD